MNASTLLTLAEAFGVCVIGVGSVWFQRGTSAIGSRLADVLDRMDRRLVNLEDRVTRMEETRP